MNFSRTVIRFFHFVVIVFLLSNECTNNILVDGEGDDSLSSRTKSKDEFDWKAYVEVYPDLTKTISSKDEAFSHYTTSGTKEDRVFTRLLPLQPGLQNAHKKLVLFLKSLDGHNVDEESKTLIIYNVESGDDSTSYEVFVNNFRIFISSVLQDNVNSKNFYWFNVMGEHNKFLNELHHLQGNQHNVAVVERTIAPHNIFVFVRTIVLIKHILENKFSSVMLLSSGVRGPFLGRANGTWLKPFQTLLFQNNVGVVGSTISCEVSPHVQTHAFLMRTQLVSTIISEYNEHKKVESANWKQEKYELGFTKAVIDAGYNISSLLHFNRVQKTFFDNVCLPGWKHFLDVPDVPNPIRWCDLTAEEVQFFRWGGESLLIPESFVCEELIQRMRKLLLTFHEENPDIQLLVPEVHKGGKFFNLYKSFDEELWREQLLIRSNSSLQPQEGKDKVCFFMRTSQMHDLQPYHNRNMSDLSITDVVAGTGIKDIIKSLQRQTDPNWEAIFFITDEKPFDQRLQQMLKEENDPRLKYLDIPLQFRPKYTSFDAGYTPTDYALRTYLTEHKHECKWFSTSNSDNVYGTEVVENVRSFPKPRKFTSTKTPDMILAPIDSRNFAEQDYQTRKTKHRWTDYCQGIISMLTLNELTYTVQPRPEVTKVDLAGSFLSTEKFLSEGLFFSNFTNRRKYPCMGCQDGYLTQHLVTHRYWTYERLPIDGVRSIVFHGPSPTWCIASGNIWFDHPKSNQVRCFPPYVLQALRKIDSVHQPIFDWDYFDHHDRVCLRFSNLGYSKFTESLNHPKPKPAAQHRSLLENFILPS